MSSTRTGVLPFVRGIDLSRNDLQDDKFARAVADMKSLQWLRLDRANLDALPIEMSKLQRLETLQLRRNKIRSISEAVPAMENLRHLNCRRNNLASVPPDLSRLEELTVLDLSHNEIREIPETLKDAVHLTVLNLSHNRIESIPGALFSNLVELLHLDLSGNQLETLPSQTRRLVFLETLILNDNPRLGHCQLNELRFMASLRTLHLGNTARTLTNTSYELEAMSSLSDVDLSSNNLPRVPDMLRSLKMLRRLNLSDNCITELPSDLGDCWISLEVFNLSRNKLEAIPSSLTKCSSLRRLYLNENLINVDGIPSSIGNLGSLEVFHAANNDFEMLPEGLLRCGRLKKLNLANNRLKTVPEGIHLLADLEVLDLSDNPDLVMPPKPPPSYDESAECSDDDFSFQNQMRRAGAEIPSLPTAAMEEPDVGEQRLRRTRDCENETDEAEKVLNGMKDLVSREAAHQSLPETHVSLKPRNWEDALEKPPIDYSELFEEDVGRMPGIFVWEIDNLLPVPLDDDYVGKFFEGDCYVVMFTYLNENHNLVWKIHYWIGRECALDKRACAAIHAVNLRNFLGARCRTVRNEQGDECEEFRRLFPEGIDYLPGGRTQSGLYAVEEIEYIPKLYRITANHVSIHLENEEPSSDSLDSHHVFVLDGGLRIFVWRGRLSKYTVMQKARLLAEKINKFERKDNAQIFDINQGEESTEFWSLLGVDADGTESRNVVIAENRGPADWKPSSAKLYQVHLRPGYLELTQVESKGGRLVKELLKTKNVYILDWFTALHIWWGKKSTKLMKSASIKLGQELLDMIPRPHQASPVRTLEGNEPMVFKSKFFGWDDVIAVDFTRTAVSVARTGADCKRWKTAQETKVDLAAFFEPRQKPPTLEEAEGFIAAVNEELDMMECLVLEGNEVVKLPKDEFGHFYSQDCYIFVCRYWVTAEIEDATADGDLDDDIRCVVYFWQGRDASNMGWLTFTFSLQERFEKVFGNKLQIEKLYQQRETDRFLAHFRTKVVVHVGSRRDRSKPTTALYCVRANGCPIFARCVQVDASAENLNSAFCYILKAPLDSSEDSIAIYVWKGSIALPYYFDLATQIAPQLPGCSNYDVNFLDEGKEPDDFWLALGGREDYFKDARFMEFLRLFRCSNERGYFSVMEERIDFCQDDLVGDDIMILDDGEDVFIWVGSKCSEVEKGLAVKSAQVYVQSMLARNPEQPRKLKLTFEGKESRRFKKCFHGWGGTKRVAD